MKWTRDHGPVSTCVYMDPVKELLADLKVWKQCTVVGSKEYNAGYRQALTDMIEHLQLLDAIGHRSRYGPGKSRRAK